MGIFRFRKFEVRNEKSAMKVNTDGVLLGALMRISGNWPRMLDIGTGTGTIALMAAQRLSEAQASQRASERDKARRLSENGHGDMDTEEGSFLIDAIDIDEASAEEAAENFAASPWSGHLRAHCTPLSGFAPETDYNLIFSNPPFFTETLHSPSARKAVSRHADALPLEEITSFAAAHLAPDGYLAMILPSSREQEAEKTAAEYGLALTRVAEIHGSDRKPAYRVVMEFSRVHGKKTMVTRENVTINMNGKYSEQYLSIVSDFLLI